ncbi:expressed unknown protein [Seminavis robusta]|uniref:Uncharacterized protein n=1 Tax=Seminavis robusta TaxID=568900 RepID=A0A9N8EX21_9STRA|nr:expressed unknown protein [Seminavis robusta]|eukprot:Sro2611_g332560.1 n/a (368) ;mRNA; r:4494-5811
MAELRKKTRLEENAPKEIFYFGYGPIVNDMVRKRRGIEVTELKPAYVPDYRLTFSFGGTANIVRKTGFEVHGLLMKLKSPKDWDKLRGFEAGNAPRIRTVVPYGGDSTAETDSNSEDCHHNADDDFFAAPIAAGAMQAYLIEMPGDVEDTLLDAPIERLPQERYLKLVANGMRKYGVDEDYITDHIEACPFIPNRKREDYFTFPVAKKVPVITHAKYEEICARASVEGDLYFTLGKRVFRMGEHDPANPLAKWFETHGHGQTDCTYMVHLTVVDPNIPLLDEPKDVTPLHVEWAENHCVEVVEQYGMSATRVYEIGEPGTQPPKDEEGNIKAEELSQDLSEASEVPRKSCLSWLCPMLGKDHHLAEQ